MSDARPYSDIPLSAADSGQDKVTEGGAWQLEWELTLDLLISYQGNQLRRLFLRAPQVNSRHEGQSLLFDNMEWSCSGLKD